MPRRPGHPPSRDELIGDFAALRAEGLGFWRSIDDAVFWTAPAPGWSPADNVRHLILSTRPVALALRVPRLALWALFGTAVAPSRTPAALRTAYLERLAGGGSAGGGFAIAALVIANPNSTSSTARFVAPMVVVFTLCPSLVIAESSPSLRRPLEAVAVPPLQAFWCPSNRTPSCPR